MAYRNIRYRLYPKTRAKAEKLDRCLGATRYVWNHFLAENRAMMEAHRLDSSNPRPPISFTLLSREFTALRNQTDWLLELPSNPIRHVLKYQADAWRQCFTSGKGIPKFKAKHRHDDSVTFTQGRFGLRGKYLHLCRIGQVALRGSNPYLDAEPVQVVVTKQSDRFFATVCYDVGEVELNDSGRFVGIDMNVGQFATSDGEIRRAPDYRKQEAKSNRYKRRMARRQGPDHKNGMKASNRYLAVRAKAKKASAKIRNSRTNWQHQESRRITDRIQYDCRRESEYKRHDEVFERNQGGTGHPCESQVGTQPLDTEHRMVRPQAQFFLQVRDHRGGCKEHQPDVPQMRAH